jgi:hypothetical protein
MKCFYVPISRIVEPDTLQRSSVRMSATACGMTSARDSVVLFVIRYASALEP